MILGDKVIVTSNNRFSNFFLIWSGKYALVIFLQTSLVSKIKLRWRIFPISNRLLKLMRSTRIGKIIGYNSLKIQRVRISRHHKK